MIAGLLTGIAARPWVQAALRYRAIILAVVLFVLALRRFGERAGRLVERLETTEKANDVQRKMLEAATRRPRSRDDLAERLRDGRFCGRQPPDVSARCRVQPGVPSAGSRGSPLLPEGSAIAEMLADYAVMQERGRACR